MHVTLDLLLVFATLGLWYTIVPWLWWLLALVAAAAFVLWLTRIRKP